MPYPVVPLRLVRYTQNRILREEMDLTNTNSLRKFFLKATGMTMTAWRDTSARAVCRGDL
jgi:hypothetical protein